MLKSPCVISVACAVWLLALFTALPRAAQTAETAEGGVKPDPKQVHKNLSLFTTSDNCVACHNVLVSPEGEDVFGAPNPLGRPSVTPYEPPRRS